MSVGVSHMTHMVNQLTLRAVCSAASFAKAPECPFSEPVIVASAFAAFELAKDQPSVGDVTPPGDAAGQSKREAVGACRMLIGAISAAKASISSAAQ